MLKLTKQDDHHYFPYLHILQYLQYYSKLIMSFVAQLQIAVHLHSFKTILFKNQGLIRFRLALFHKLSNNQSRSISCVPFEILGKPSDKEWLPSLINKEDNSYHSQALPVRATKQDYAFDEICIFRAEIPMESMEEVEIICNAELFFSPEAMFSDYNQFESLSTFDAKISKVSKISEYFCITFDDFEGFRVNASYNASILQFKFIQNKNSIYRTFAEYVQATTEGFLKKQTRTFYTFYKRAMEEELHFLRQKIEGITNVHGSMIYGAMKKSKIIPISSNKVDLEIEKLSHQQTHINNPQIRKIIEAIAEDLILMKKEGLQLWRKYLGLILQNSNKMISLGRAYFQTASKERLKCHVFSHQIKSFDPTQSKYEEVGKQHLYQASNEKKKFVKEASPLNFNIENVKYYPVETKAPKLFEEIYYTGKKPLTQRMSPNCLHVFILVHGFQATRKDMELFRVMLETSVSNCQIMVSCYNEGKTESSIEKLANNFATEVTNYLTSLGKIEYKVSFIGHSMGGIIIRAGLQYLAQFNPRFWTFASLSSPHLGYLAHNSQLVNAGLWYLNTWEKCQSISQLAMVDSIQLQNTFLYKLSKDPNIKYFQNVAFISSYQDSYVSFESARVEKTGKIIENALRKDKNCQVICEMSQNIINNLHCVKFSRIDVIFDIQENNLDSLIGRTAHVKLLSDKGFVKILIQVFQHIFR